MKLDDETGDFTLIEAADCIAVHWTDKNDCSFYLHNADLGAIALRAYPQ